MNSSKIKIRFIFVPLFETYKFQGTVTRDFRPSIFFAQNTPPRPLMNRPKRFSSFFKFSPRYSIAKFEFVCQQQHGVSVVNNYANKVSA